MNEFSTDMTVIPCELTSLVQALDIWMNKPFKEILKQQLNLWMLECEKLFTKGGEMYHISLEIMCEQIIKAWDKIKYNIIKK